MKKILMTEYAEDLSIRKNTIFDNMAEARKYIKNKENCKYSLTVIVEKTIVEKGVQNG